MQLRTKLIIYSMACCALGVIISLSLMHYFAPSQPQLMSRSSNLLEAPELPDLSDIEVPEIDLEHLKETLTAIDTAIDMTEQVQIALSMQEKIRAEQIKIELQQLEKLKEEQLQRSMMRLEQLKEGLYGSAPYSAVPIPPMPELPPVKLPTINQVAETINPPSWVDGLLLLLLACGVCGIGVAFLTRHLGRSLNALEVGLLNFNDNDFSVSIPEVGEGQLKALAHLFNESAGKLRQERQYIYQRELLLDKVIQSSPNVMLLLNDQQKLMYANDAARHLFQIKGKMEGLHLDDLLASLPEVWSHALKQEKSGLFTMGDEDADTWYLNRGHFLLNNQQHHLILLKQMTRELNRQEVAVWKKVIRIISHELNNSVAPIASMVNSGRFLTKELDDPKLTLIFDTIESRTHHLSQFIYNYARFAKLPLPQRRTVKWDEFINQLTQHYPFKLTSSLPDIDGCFDQGQLEQVLLNLLKNAHESGSPSEDVTLSIRYQVLAESAGFNLRIEDRGSGMSGEVLEQALLPFYSTKQSGTGLGLPLCREIIEAHDGSINLHNRSEGGLSVQLWLPLYQQAN
ncbi:ATP-binding protein [Shewanella sp. A25]|nr:ATP-binding protein [Shewanella shenzhenensis]